MTMHMQSADYAWAVFGAFITLVLLAGWRVMEANAGLFALETAAVPVCETSLVPCDDLPRAGATRQLSAALTRSARD